MFAPNGIHFMWAMKQRLFGIRINLKRKYPKESENDNETEMDGYEFQLYCDKGTYTHAHNDQRNGQSNFYS